MKHSVLVTGAAGFIGFHLCSRLLKRGTPVLGFDNLNHYYDPTLKTARLNKLKALGAQMGTPFASIEADLEDQSVVEAAFRGITSSKGPSGLGPPTKVVNLAAQAGVRYSIENPAAYVQSNLVGFGHVLESCRQHGIEHLVYASSSSVYGGNAKMPFAERQSVDHPVSLYAATKKANELMAHSYSHLYGLPATGLRFFTVYGPWGRPDMAIYLFTNAILEGRPIKVYNQGGMIRDFTYIDDVAESIIRVLDKPATPDKTFDPINPNPATSWAPHRIFNIGNAKPTPLMEYIEAIEGALGMAAIKELLPIQSSDMPATAADASALEDWIGFKPCTPVRKGVASCVAWYRDFYNA